MIIKTKFYKKKIRSLCLKIFNKIENNGLSDFDMNGEKVFIDNLIRCFHKKREDNCVIFDVGANVGKYTDLLVKKIGTKNYKIYCFEPTKYCLNRLKNKFDKFSRININDFGLSDEEIKTEIFYNEEGSGLASIYKRNLDYYGIKLDKSETVKLKRADFFLDNNKIKHLDLLKMDIEGNELKALCGFGKYLNVDFIDFIQFEYGGANLDSKTSLLDIYALLHNRDFIVAKIMKNGLEIRDYEPYMENYMYSNYVAISKNMLKKIK